MTKTVAVIAASLREGSINCKLAGILEGLGQERLAFRSVDIGALPHYDDDLWADPPPAVTRMKDVVAAADGVLIVSPEYNRTYPGVLANAFDWGSRPYGKSAWRGKPVALTGATKGATATAAAQQHLRLAAVNLGMIPMSAPEAWISWTDDRFGEDGSVRSDDTRKLLQGFIDAFADWIHKHG